MKCPALGFRKDPENGAQDGLASVTSSVSMSVSASWMTTLCAGGIRSHSSHPQGLLTREAASLTQTHFLARADLQVALSHHPLGIECYLEISNNDDLYLVH